MTITYYVNIEETYMYCHIVTVCYCLVYHNSFPVPDGAYSSYTYVGCHKDDEKRDIPYDLLEGTTGNPMTPDRCSEHCQDYLVFGVQIH